MKMEKTGLFVVFLLIVFLIGMSIWTSRPTEEVLSEAIEVAEHRFQADAKAQNHQVGNLSLYLPENFEIEEKTVNNVLLTKDEQTYILFYNVLESQKSNLNYEAAKEGNDHEWLVSFENQDRFGYISIIDVDEEFELQLGVGGVKVPTISSRDELVQDVTDMMDIANSITYEESGGS
ncbi:hypothetical protein ACTNEO_09225 [Gracilibacillus sp. HCP3S3_G5_1]|uniref:hypothetical protein n=1 Tax=unclassified Gracilibacillus TaxID=2625209 RepID=UPI003F88A31E